MSGHQGPVADGGVVDEDRPASLLLGLELFVQSLLFVDDGSQGVGHLLELRLIRVVELIHPLGERPVYDVIAAGVPGGCLMYHGDDFPQEGELLVLYCRSRVRGVYVFLIFLWWRDVCQGFMWGCSAAAEVLVFHVHEEPAFRADPLSSMPDRACFDRVDASFTGYFE